MSFSMFRSSEPAVVVFELPHKIDFVGTRYKFVTEDYPSIVILILAKSPTGADLVFIGTITEGRYVRAVIDHATYYANGVWTWSVQLEDSAVALPISAGYLLPAGSWLWGGAWESIAAKTENTEDALTAIGDAVTTIGGQTVKIGVPPESGTIADGIGMVLYAIGTPSGASIAADIGAISAAVDTVDGKVDTAINSIGDVETALTEANNGITTLRKILTNNLRIEEDELRLYDDDGTTLIAAWALYDAESQPTSVPEAVVSRVLIYPTGP